MIQDDFELTSKDVQDLANRNAIASFFASLGYDTNDRLEQNVSAMGFTSDLLKSSIKYIERLASEDGGLLEVYLLELKSVTVSVTHALARAFRNSSVQVPLLILTDDYQRLDFVLVERYSAPTNVVQEPLAGFPPATPRQVIVRPRVLTVQRHQPGKVELRVLRRFSYTEGDSFAQYDKLLSAYIVAEWSEPYFNNRALFSDHYLTQRLPESPEWGNQANATQMTRAYRELRALYEDARETFATVPASKVRAELIGPALELLGFSLQQVPQNTETVEPTYYLTDQKQASGQPPLVVCLAYSWGRSLDGKDEQRDQERPDENPGAVVVSLLDRGQANWAIVTNGKIWRLYSAKAHSRATNYYEIDLEETLAISKEQPKERELAFRYFWYFFRVDAYQITEYKVEGESRQMCFLDSLVNDSERYAQKLGDRLKERVFFEIFPHFARGFITYARQTGQFPANLETLSDTDRAKLLDPFFQGTLTFLYRLLFLLYAESRDLLPVRETRGYYGKSLEKMKREIEEQIGRIVDQAPERIRMVYGEQSTALYDRLQELFHGVDAGNAALNIPIYNGGFFITEAEAEDTSPEAEAARFLASHKIPDVQLALGLDRMARDLDEKTLELVFIDFKSLGVRQLGSIYEGLLEFKLRIALTNMAIIKGKKTEEVVPYAEAIEKKLPIVKIGRGKDAREKILLQGEVYLENDRRERKATGSYYTPDYVVEYIIEQTVGPILREKLEALRPLFREAEQLLRNKREKNAALKKMNMRVADDPERETYVHYQKTLNEAFFDLKVLDPAMGSGHFLVEAVDFITDRMADFLSSFRWNPVVYELTLTRVKIQEEMERQGVSIDMSKLTDLNLLKRRVLKSCIYGVDLNHMAVQLARVSLWLDCFTLGAPLSFLDHHMKYGNSLIGGNVREVQNAIGSGLWANQFTHLLSSTQLMREVGKSADATAQEIRASRSAYKGAFNLLAPFKRLLDVWTSEYFNNSGGKQMTRYFPDAIYDDTYEDTLSDREKKIVANGLKIAENRHFFHWELEFPEVFFDETKRKENGGFDAVVGNPPYVRQEGLGDDKTVLNALYTSYHSIADLYTYFIECGHMLLCNGGRFGMITANKFIRANYGAKLRSYLATKVNVEKLIDFGDLPVFEEASTYPLITISNKMGVQSEIIYAQLTDLAFADLRQAVQEQSTILPDGALKSLNWTLAADMQKAILSKIWKTSVPLQDYIPQKIEYGVKTGFNDAFMIDSLTRSRLIAQDALSEEIIKPLVIGEDVKRYELAIGDRYLIFTRRGIDISRYPAIYNHLLAFREQLEPRPKNWSDSKGVWPGRKPGPYNWYEIQDNVAYYSEFEQPKIMWPVIAVSSRFAFDDSGYYSNDKTFFIPANDFYLLALLNSRTIFFFLRSELSSLRGGYLEYRAQTLVRTPIRHIIFTLPPNKRTGYLQKVKNLYQHCLDKDDQQCVLGFVDHHLSQQPEESDVVHDLLAFLAEEMIRLNREKQAAQQKFLDWLVATLKIGSVKEGRSGIDTLTNKTDLLDYPGDYQKGEPALSTEKLVEILRKNKNRLGMSLNGNGLVDTIATMYEESLQKVLPLKETLRKTDALIDAVVYRLYGLTEEEIKVVEGKA